MSFENQNPNLWKEKDSVPEEALNDDEAGEEKLKNPEDMTQESALIKEEESILSDEEREDLYRDTPEDKLNDLGPQRDRESWNRYKSKNQASE